MDQKTNPEVIFRDDLYQYLTSLDRVDQHLPEAPDLEALWAKIGESYLPDALREWNQYPTVAMGWIMYVGMAMAKYWDMDWELYSKVDDLYKYLRDRIDFDHMDDYILDKVLCLETARRNEINDAVAECASRTYSKISHMHLEGGTADAYRAFVAALHQMYLMGIAVELKQLGYHMTKID